MEFVGGLPTSRKGHDYLFMLVDMFSNMCVLVPFKKTINGKEATNLFFGQVFIHFRIPRSIILGRDTSFFNALQTKLLENMDTNLKRSTNIPSIDIWANKSSQYEFSVAFEGLQPKAYEDLG